MILLLFVACESVPTESEVWRIQYAPAELELEHTTYASNFSEFTPWDSEDLESEPSEWMTEASSSGSDGLAYLTIQVDAEGVAFVTYDATAYVGTYVDGVLEVEWDWWTTYTESANHESGYTYSAASTEGLKQAFSFTIDGEHGAGTIRYVEYDESALTQSDEFEDEMSSSNIWISESDGNRLINEGNADDCEGEVCSTEVVSETLWASEATAERVTTEEAGDLMFVRNGSGA